MSAIFISLSALTLYIMSKDYPYEKPKFFRPFTEKAPAILASSALLFIGLFIECTTVGVLTGSAISIVLLMLFFSFFVLLTPFSKHYIWIILGMALILSLVRQFS